MVEDGQFSGSFRVILGLASIYQSSADISLRPSLPQSTVIQPFDNIGDCSFMWGRRRQAESSARIRERPRSTAHSTANNMAFESKGSAAKNISEFSDPRPLNIRVREVGRRLLTHMASGKMKLPMLPAVATEAMSLASNPDASFRDIHRVIGNDNIITAKVISTANSAIYHTGTPITSLMSALNRLGMGVIRDLLYQAVAEAHFFHGLRGEELQEQRSHSVEVAHAARLVANIVRLNSEYPFLCGLLHDIGRTVLLDTLQLRPPPELRQEELPRVIDGFHTVVGEQLAKHWDLPAIVGEAARSHHRYRSPGYPDGYSKIGNVIACAQQALRRNPEAEISPQENQIYVDLGLTDDQRLKLFTSIEKLRQSLSPET